MHDPRFASSLGVPRQVTKTQRDVRQLLVSAERNLLDNPPASLLLAAALLVLALVVTLVMALRLNELPLATLAAARESAKQFAMDVKTFHALATKTFTAPRPVSFAQRTVTENMAQLAGTGYLLLSWLGSLLGWLILRTFAVSTFICGFLGGAHIFGKSQRRGEIDGVL